MTSLRVMTYNVRRCQGWDARTRPDRIAAVIRSAAPDIVALQEVDVNRVRSGRRDEPAEIAEAAGLSSYFAPREQGKDGAYGLAFLSRRPLHVRKIARLHPERRNENTIAFWVETDDGWGFINTHFLHGRHERRQAAETLVGRDWIGGARSDAPIVLLGDFNSTTSSHAYQILRSRLRPAAEGLSDGAIPVTWPSLFPVFRLDHIFLSPGWDVSTFRAPSGGAARWASDHLPLVADLARRVCGERASGRSRNEPARR